MARLRFLVIAWIFLFGPKFAYSANYPNLACQITTVAGIGPGPYNGNNIPALSCAIDTGNIAFDISGNLIFTDTTNQILRKIDKITGIVSTIAGTGTNSFSGDGGLAINATFYWPGAIAVDSVGNIFVTDYINARVREIFASNGY